MGADVTVVEVLPQILPVEDAEIAGLARKRFEKQGIKIMTSTRVTKLEKGADDVTATIEDDKGNKQILKASRLISAVGVTGNIENLGLEKLGVKTDARHHRHRRRGAHQCAGDLCDRRRRRPAHAGPQGRARRRHLRRGDQGPRAPPDGQADDSRLHLLPAADRLGRPHRSQGQGGGLSSSRSAVFPSSATARRSRSANPTVSSRPSSTRRPASSSAPI